MDVLLVLVSAFFSLIVSKAAWTQGMSALCSLFTGGRFEKNVTIDKDFGVGSVLLEVFLVFGVSQLKRSVVWFKAEGKLEKQGEASVCE